MNDYIKREDVLTLFDFTTEATESEAEADAAMFLTELIKPLINNLPTADVVERKVGKWSLKWHSFFKQDLPACSCCGLFSVLPYRYCPNCGADMRPTQSNDSNALNALEREGTT